MTTSKYRPPAYSDHHFGIPILFFNDIKLPLNNSNSHKFQVVFVHMSDCTVKLKEALKWKINILKISSYIISQCLHAAGEPLGVGLQPAELVSVVRQPAVVDVDVGVAGVRVAFRRQDVGHLEGIQVNFSHIFYY